MEIKEQRFGVEIELTGITRSKAAKVIADYYNTGSIDHEGSVYDTYSAKDSKGRTWKAMSDSSIQAQKKMRGGDIVSATPHYRTEVVTPILEWDDIADLQEILRQLRHSGAIVNSSCGIHIHVDASAHTPKTLRNLLNIMASKQDLIYKALAVDKKREHYCKKLESDLVSRINKDKPKSLSEFEDDWYSGYYGDRSAHYNNSRYHALNLHATFTKGTVEFRLFNSTTHAGELKAYIQFCLAINAQAMNQKSASPKNTESNNEKYTFRTWLLRLGMIGEEFATAREHLLKKLDGDIAFKGGRPAA